MKRDSRILAESIKNGFKNLFRQYNLTVPEIYVERSLSIQSPYGEIYSPRIDVTVGPIARNQRMIQTYDYIMERLSSFLQDCIDQFQKNLPSTTTWAHIGSALNLNPFIGDNTYNKNARCSFAIEIEYSGSRKHRLGGIVNSSSLGRVGMIIVKNDEILKSFISILEYCSLLKLADKPSLKYPNILLLEKDQLLNVLSRTRAGV